MAIIETKADQLVALVDQKKTVTAKEAAAEMNVTEEYIRKLAAVLEKNKIIDLKAGAFTLTMIAR